MSVMVCDLYLNKAAFKNLKKKQIIKDNEFGLDEPAINPFLILKLLLFHCQVVSDSFETPWTVAHQAPLFRRFSRQEYWSGLLFPFPGDLPDPWTDPTSPAFAGGFFTTESPGKP